MDYRHQDPGSQSHGFAALVVAIVTLAGVAWMYYKTKN
jgi:hypothetical protein